MRTLSPSPSTVSPGSSHAHAHAPSHCFPHDPPSARTSPIGDGSRPERGPQHTGHLVSRCPHRATKNPTAQRLQPAVTPHKITTLRAVRCGIHCPIAMDPTYRLKALHLPFPISRPGKRHFASRTFVVAKGNPTRGLSTCTRTHPSEPYTATAGTPVSQTANMHSSI